MTIDDHTYKPALGGPRQEGYEFKATVRPLRTLMQREQYRIWCRPRTTGTWLLMRYKLGRQIIYKFLSGYLPNQSVCTRAPRSSHSSVVALLFRWCRGTKADRMPTLGYRLHKSNTKLQDWRRQEQSPLEGGQGGSPQRFGDDGNILFPILPL